MDIECWNSTHVFHVLFVALPSLLFWGILIPTICLYILYKNRKSLGSIKIRKRYGFLFNGYTKSEYYWEFVILYRKILIISCSVFIANLASVNIQALTVLILLIISLVMQLNFSPYSGKELNTMEVRSILVSTVTIYCGLYYLTGDLDYVSRVIFFIIIVVANIYFLYIWITGMFGAGV